MTSLEVAAWITAAATGLTALGTVLILWRNRRSASIQFYRLFKASKISDEPNHWVQVYTTNTMLHSNYLHGKVIKVTRASVTLSSPKRGNVLVAMPQIVSAHRSVAHPLPPSDWEPSLDRDPSTLLRYRFRRSVQKVLYKLLTPIV